MGAARCDIVDVTRSLGGRNVLSVRIFLGNTSAGGRVEGEVLRINLIEQVGDVEVRDATAIAENPIAVTEAVMTGGASQLR